MSDWINSALDSDILQLQKCANTMMNWLTGIPNSFSSTITNGFTEGCNNKIKVLKRNAYGYRNFNRFRNRILNIFSSSICQSSKTSDSLTLLLAFIFSSFSLLGLPQLLTLNHQKITGNYHMIVACCNGLYLIFK